MSQLTGPLLLDIRIDYDGTDPSQALYAPDPRTWLCMLVEHTEYLITHWEELQNNYGEENIGPALPAIRNARLNANSALQAIEAGNVNEAIASAFRAGQSCDRAKTIVPIFGSLRKRKAVSVNANEVRAEKRQPINDRVIECARELIGQGIPQSQLVSNVCINLKANHKITRSNKQVSRDLEAAGLWKGTKKRQS